MLGMGGDLDRRVEHHDMPKVKPNPRAMVKQLGLFGQDLHDPGSHYAAA
jgi:hypothetical protein